jgi:hypothetical protein
MVSKWFKKNSQLGVESELNHKQIGKITHLTNYGRKAKM